MLNVGLIVLGGCEVCPHVGEHDAGGIEGAVLGSSLSKCAIKVPGVPAPLQLFSDQSRGVGALAQIGGVDEVSRLHLGIEEWQEIIAKVDAASQR